MRLSYFCKWCGEHLRKGDHGDCKIALRDGAKRERDAERRRQEQREKRERK